ncbi:MAG TPA: glycosyltransferase family 2 protein [Terriglobales bacterium]
MGQENSPVVSVIVPARNEEACLASCLESLVKQTGIPFEVIVVDDGSTDRTPEIARSFGAPQPDTVQEGMVSASPGTTPIEARGFNTLVTVISAPLLPQGWTGKNNAMAAGAKLASGKWLLFTDADTVHQPASLAHAVAEAERHGASLLSYSPEQEVRTLLEKALMPVIFAELAAAYSPSKVSDPASPTAAANGQYLLISREAYDAVGGHAEVASDLLEDVAVARLVKSSGRRIRFRYGGDAVRTRMYRSWSQMKEGWTKNLALLFKHPLRRALTLLAMWAFAWITFGLGLAAIVAGSWKLAYWLPWIFVLYARIARARFRIVPNLAAVIFGIPLTAYLLLRSASRHRHGGVTWKGREYSADLAKATHNLAL